jgi:D-lactate dehydrogenase
MPAVEAIVDRCIEGGFCEPLCPSHGLTLSPRQRIVSWRELSRRAAAGEKTDDIAADFAYMGLDTCAGCGLCSTACPVGINTGEVTRLLRGRSIGPVSRKIGQWTAGNFGKVAALSRFGLQAGHLAADVVGDAVLARLSGGAWKAGMPRPGKPVVRYRGEGDPVVYFPACGGRIFGANCWYAQATHRACRKASMAYVAARCWPAKAWPTKPTRWAMRSSMPCCWLPMTARVVFTQ